MDGASPAKKRLRRAQEEYEMALHEVICDALHEALGRKPTDYFQQKLSDFLVGMEP